MGQPRILIIEDERGLTQTLSWYFNREGIETVVVHDGAEGLRKAQTLLADLRYAARRLRSTPAITIPQPL